MQTEEVVAPQPLVATTHNCPDRLFVCSVIELVPCPLIITIPAGAVQLYCTAPVTADTENTFVFCVIAPIAPKVGLETKFHPVLFPWFVDAKALKVAPPDTLISFSVKF